jgi:hypothetical protein
MMQIAEGAIAARVRTAGAGRSRHVDWRLGALFTKRLCASSCPAPISIPPRLECSTARSSSVLPVTPDHSARREDPDATVSLAGASHGRSIMWALPAHSYSAALWRIPQAVPVFQPSRPGDETCARRQLVSAHFSRRQRHDPELQKRALVSASPRRT